MLRRVSHYRRGLFIKVTLLLIGVPLVLLAYIGGPPPGHTGGFGEPNCTASGCHSDFGVNPSGGSVTIGLPAAYTPGAQHQITVTISDTAAGRRAWGFQLSARFRNGQQAGSFANGTNVRFQVGSSGILYINHSPAQTAPGASFTYTVTWTAPADSAGGDVLFNAAGNAANGNGAPSGDRIFLTQATLSAGAPGAAPRVNAGGIVNGASFTPAPNNTAASGALFSIFGDNLAPSEASAGAIPLPTTLNGTQVLVNGVAAPLIYVSKTQINAQIPFEAPTGASVNVMVRAGTSDSPAEAVRVDTTSPGIFTVNSSGTGAGAILKSDNVTLVTANTPARPGEVVVIYCTGLGQTQDSKLETGKAGAGQRTLDGATVSIGGQNARVDFSGATANFVGLYQVNAVVPNLPAGDHEVLITIGGKQSRAGVTVRVAP